MWRCECGGGHFLSVTWQSAGQYEDFAEFEGYLQVEGDSSTSWRDRVAQSWRLLTSGCAATRVGVVLTAASAREVAAVLTDFAAGPGTREGTG